MFKKNLDPILKRIIEENIVSIEKGDFKKALNEALKNGVEGDFIDYFYEAEISVSTSQVQNALDEYYSNNCVNLSKAEKEKKVRDLEYLINKAQIAAFKVLC
jgi:hypothetical protein